MTHYVLDVDYFIFRSIEALKGKVENPLFYGTLNMIKALIKREKPRTLTLCYDSKVQWKRGVLKEYRKEKKEGEEVSEEEFRALIETCAALGLVQLYTKWMEADELIASVINSFDEGIILGDDHDFFQLLSPKKKMVAKEKVVTHSLVEKETGLKECSLYADYLALVGDPGDNIPRIFSSKRAKEIVNKKGRLKDWFFNFDFKGLEKEDIKTLMERRGDILKNLLLVDLRDYTFSPYFLYSTEEDQNLDKVREKFKEYEMKRFLEKFEEFEGWERLSPLKILKRKAEIEKDKSVYLLKEREDYPISYWRN